MSPVCPPFALRAALAGLWECSPPLHASVPSAQVAYSAQDTHLRAPHLGTHFSNEAISDPGTRLRGPDHVLVQEAVPT